MATTTHLANSQPPFFETAQIRVVSRWPIPRSVYKWAYVLVSSRIYWKVAREDGGNKPQSFIDFQNADSVELVRLEDGTWDDVDGHVKVENHDGNRRIIVSGRRTRLHTPFRGSNVRIEIISNAPEQLERFVNQAQARIAPWKLLQQETNRAPSCGVEEIEKALGGFIASRIGTELSPLSNVGVEGKQTDTLGVLPEQMEKLSIVDELTAHGTAAVQTCAALSKLVAEHVGETAEVVAGVAKCVGGLSTMFHLVALGAKGVSMCAEASRGRRVLIDLLAQIMVLLQYTLESMTEILKSSRKVTQIDNDFVFDVFKHAVDAVDVAETQLLRGRGRQIIYSGDVKEVERKLKELIHQAVMAGAIAKICKVGDEVGQLKEDEKIWDAELSHVRPSLSAFFSGRTRELDILRGTLEKHGSAVITQYGGLGKTELMIALADRAERDESVPGGVFWVTLDGGESDVIESLARLVEKLAGKKMDEERRNPNMVIAALKRELGGRKGRWLLCLDNADDSRVSGILNEVCAIAGGKRGDGWVVVTSRQGQPHIWNRMKIEQKLVLETLCVEDAMVALWRQIRKIGTDDADDELVMNAIKELEGTDVAEYRALKELCGNEGECSLGGLPLALVQAGAYIARFQCSIAKYLKMFKSANKIEDMEDIMWNTEEVKPIQESQRSVWTTWKMNVGQLSDEAYSVLRGMAMLGAGDVREEIVRGIVKGVTGEEGGNVDRMFRKNVIEGLVYGSSLIYRDEGGREGEEGRVYRMHRLVRLFVLREMERGSNLWNKVYSNALVTVHEVVETELTKEDKSFTELPDVFGNRHREFVVHATALVDHYTLPRRDATTWNASKVEEIYTYVGVAMRFMGKLEKEVEVWERLVQMLHHQRASNQGQRGCEAFSDTDDKKNSDIARVYNSLGEALFRNGKFDAALSKHKKSLELYLAIHGHDKPHPHIATSLRNTANVYFGFGKLEDALQKHQKSLEILLAIHGDDKPHPQIATSLSNIGNVYLEQGKLEDALQKHQKGLEMLLAIHGYDKPHPHIANSLSNIGNVYQGLGKLEDALENHQKSLEMKLAIHGHETSHPNIAISLTNIGNVYEGLGKLEDALEKHQKSLEMYLAIHGHEKPHPHIAISLNNIGNVYREVGKLEDALQNHRKSLKMLLVIHGHDNPHPHIANSLSNIGNVFEGLGKLEDALEKHQKSLEMELAIYGHEKPHPHIAISLTNIGNVYEGLGKLEDALEKHLKSLEMKLAIHGHDKPHPDIAISLGNIGTVYRGLGKLEDALENHQKSLEMKLAIHGHDKPHPHIANSLSNIANVYRELGNLEDALENHQKSLEMELAIYGHEKPHPHIAISLWNIGFVYYKQEMLNQAAEFLERSLAMLQIVHAGNSQHPHILELLCDLADVYEDQGRRDEAAAIRKRNEWNTETGERSDGGSSTL